MDHAAWLTTSLICLAAAVIAVPLARALGLGSIIGYLAAGIVIGPWGLKLVTDTQTILSVAEFGVVLMLFLVGLEPEPRRLWAMRRPIFGWGTVQVGLCTALIVAAGVAFGVSWPVALAAALGLALSSTAIGLAVLNERRAMPTNAGQGVLAIALFQDVAALRRLQIVASGTDVPMWEIQHRYEALFVAIQKSNWEMGVYHLEKLRDRMNGAGMKRPARTQNIEGMFLKSGVWPRTWAFSTTARRSCAPRHFSAMAAKK